MRVSRRHAGTALLVAALLLGATAASLRFFAASPGRSATAGAVGLTPGADRSGAANPDAPVASPTSSASSAAGQSADGASAGVVVPPAVTVTGAAALPSAHVHAGYDTPVDVVVGFYQALLSGTPAKACAYVTAPCPSFGSRPVTGRVAVIEAVSQSGKALVQVTGTVCVGTSCVPLTDRVMMPTGPASLSSSWTKLTSAIYGWASSPLPCVQDQATRQWRVMLA